MRPAIIFPSIINRITHRSNLLMVILVGVLLDGFRIFINPTHLSFGELVFPFIFLFLQVTLAPVPWLWKTPEKPKWFFVRRFLAALVFNVIWVAIGIAVIHCFTPFPGRYAKPSMNGKSKDFPRPPLAAIPGWRPEKFKEPGPGKPDFEQQKPGDDGRLPPDARDGMPQGPGPKPPVQSLGGTPGGRPEKIKEPAPGKSGSEQQKPGDAEGFSPDAMERMPQGPGPKPRVPFFPEVSLGLLNVAFALIFGWETAEKELTEARERRMAKLLRESQSKALRNQLDPHVLYNALNGISELIHEDPLAAEEAVALLASLYRTLTDYGKADTVHLAEERNLVEAYLSMEQMRLGDRLQVEWEWPSWADDIQAPPLFLQPLVENAIKHGISSREAGGALRIACLREGPALVLQVANTGLPPATDGHKGVGLENLKARLGLWNDVSGSFSLRREGEWTIARVEWIPRSDT